VRGSAALRRGDAPTILARLADDVTWEHGTDSAKVPWVQIRCGKDDVGDAFRKTDSVDAYRFEASTFFESDNVVTALVTFELPIPTSEPNGVRVHTWQEVHQWFFNADDQVSRFRQRADRSGRDAGHGGQGKLLPFARPAVALAWH
jgi:hypothetical protein